MIMSKRFFSLLLLIPCLYLFQSCEGGDYRRESIGEIGSIYVVMDSTQWHSQTADAIRKVFASPIITLPSEQPRFDLTFHSLRTTSDLDFAKKQKNVIFAAPLEDTTSNTAEYLRSLLSKPVQQLVLSGKNFAFPLKDKWYNDQWTLLLTSTSDSTLASHIVNAEQQLLDNLLELQRKRWQAYLYDRGEQFDIEDTLWKRHGWKFRVEHDYVLNVDTANFVSLRRYMPQNDRWIWVWWKDNVTDIDYLDSQWINATRDSLNEQYIRGTEDSSYVTTQYRRAVISRPINFKNYYGLVTRGAWRMTHDLMGGPFVNYTFYVPSQKRLYMMEFSEYAPRYLKRRFIRQFEAMAYTFQADSTLSAEQLSGKTSAPAESARQGR